MLEGIKVMGIVFPYNDMHSEKLSTPLQTREYGLDILRILSMYLIVLLHVLAVGGGLVKVEFSEANWWGIWSLRIITAIGVNCFGILSGYLGLESKHRKSSIAALWSQVACLSLAGYMLSWLTSGYSPAFMDIVYGMMPVTFGQYWYFSAYFVLFFAMPCLNQHLLKTGNQGLLTELVIMGLFLIALPRISGNFGEAIGLSSSNGVIWLGYLYCLGAVLRKNRDWLLRIPSAWLALIWLLGVLGSLGCQFVYAKWHLAKSSSLVCDNNSPFVIFSSLAVFLLCQRVRLSGRHQLLEIASAISFSVYIIHFHPRFQSLFLSNRFIEAVGYSPLLCVVTLLLASAIIYLGCTVMDLPRYVLFKKLKIKQRLAFLDRF